MEPTYGTSRKDIKCHNMTPPASSSPSLSCGSDILAPSPPVVAKECQPQTNRSSRNNAENPSRSRSPSHGTVENPSSPSSARPVTTTACLTAPLPITVTRRSGMSSYSIASILGETRRDDPCSIAAPLSLSLEGLQTSPESVVSSPSSSKEDHHDKTHSEGSCFFFSF